MTAAEDSPPPVQRRSLLLGTLICGAIAAAAPWMTSGTTALLLTAGAALGLGACLARMVPIPRAAPATSGTMPQPVATPTEPSSAAAPEGNPLLETCELLEADLDSAVAEIIEQSSLAVRRGSEAAEETKTITGDAQGAARAAEQASRNVTSVASAAEELSASSREIGAQAARTAEAAREAVGESERAAATMNALHQAAERIGEFVKTISDVAAKTNLLALNATIEAARAGEAGKGFAVVASEVKALSRQTASATEDIARRIQEIQAATRTSVTVIGSVGSSIRQIEDASAGVAGAVTQQEATIAEIARNVGATASEVTGVAKSIETMAEKTTRIAALTGTATATVVDTDRRIGELRASLIVSLRSSAAGDRRVERRVPVEIAAHLESGGRTHAATILDLSSGGALVRCPVRLPERSPATLAIDGIGRIAVEALATHEAGLHIRFTAMPDVVRQALLERLAALTTADRPFIDAAKSAALRIAEAFAAALDRGTCSEAELFSDLYRPVAGTEPPSFVAPFTDLADRVLPPIQGPVLSFAPSVIFCAAVDRNGYLPTKSSNPSYPKEHGGASGRRLFNDRIGLTAARSTRDHVLQSYRRDLGTGTAVAIKEVSAPIKVRGRHWGALRLAYRAT